jgi:alpha-L-fucosidase 2
MTETRLWYTKPAANWNQALPVGSGRLGGMVLGGVDRELIQLNESTLWSGYPRDDQNYEAIKYLPEARRLLAEEKYDDAHRLITDKMLGVYNQSYLALGDLHLEFEDAPAPENYCRELDLARAVASTSFGPAAARHTRHVFASHADQVLVVRLETAAPDGLNFSVRLDSPIRHQIQSGAAAQAELLMTGQAPCHVDPNYHNVNAEPVIYDTESPGKGMLFAAFLRASIEGGTVCRQGDRLVVRGAGKATVLLSAATSFDGPDKIPATTGKDPVALCHRTLDAASHKSYEQLLADHVADHQSLFGLAELDLGPASTGHLPTDERLRLATAGQVDPSLIALLFHFGRYLMIASSRPGGQPANQQGLWNNMLRPPWSCNWTSNINTQMNYWPVEPCNLAPCHEPLFDLIDELRPNGGRTARIQHGCGGWVCHHNVDIWRTCIPVAGSPTFAYWPMGGVWYCRHLWEHYLFSLDKDFLARAWPAIRGAAEFVLDWMIEDEDGHLITSPSTSPENSFFEPGTEHCVSVTQGCAMDLTLCRELLEFASKTAEILQQDAHLGQRCRDAAARVRPLRIGSKGQLLEWDKEFKEQDPHHRHVSHLVGLFPGGTITAEGTPELYEAARRSLEVRGDGGTGWSMAWKVSLWARLRDGDHAMLMLRNFLQLVDDSADTDYGHGGIYGNLFCAHPPFQIDGNFGVTAGIAEMLLQSHAGEIHLLPALPADWPTGHVRGLRTRGGGEVDMQWRDGKLASAILRAKVAGKHKVRYGGRTKTIDLPAGVAVDFIPQ